MSATGDPQAGATLIEALVVVALTAMIGAIVFPNLRSGGQRAMFEQAAAGLRADLRMARAQALRTDRPVTLQVEQDERHYGWANGPRRVLVGDLRIAAGAGVAFLSDGSLATSSATDASVRLTDGRRGKVFAIDPATGLLRGGS
ncbi:pilus assembly FimT family protein [Caulobacter sp.]|uniref:pilus assembly FimT family protein n=1 Tax=Caulobacter sp. TaxID=78 RepID=UPI003BAF1736